MSRQKLPSLSHSKLTSDQMFLSRINSKTYCQLRKIQERLCSFRTKQTKKLPQIADNNLFLLIERQAIKLSAGLRAFLDLNKAKPFQLIDKALKKYKIYIEVRQIFTEDRKFITDVEILKQRITSRQSLFVRLQGFIIRIRQFCKISIQNNTRADSDSLFKVTEDLQDSLHVFSDKISHQQQRKFIRSNIKLFASHNQNLKHKSISQLIRRPEGDILTLRVNQFLMLQEQNLVNSQRLLRNCNKKLIQQHELDVW